MGLVLGDILSVVQGVHRLALLPCLLYGGRMGLVGRSRGVSLPLLPSCGA